MQTLICKSLSTSGRITWSRSFTIDDQWSPMLLANCSSIMRQASFSQKKQATNLGQDYGQEMLYLYLSGYGAIKK